MVAQRLRGALIAASPLLLLFPVLAAASTATSDLAVSLSIVSTCTVGTVGAVAFGNAGILAAPLTATGTISVTCTTTTPYSMGLNQGANGASVTSRELKGATSGALISYALYQDAAHSINWGNTSGFWETGVGAGGPQTMTVYGVLPPQTTPTADSFSDSVTITVNY